jgi:hypothetical protein
MGTPVTIISEVKNFEVDDGRAGSGPQQTLVDDMRRINGLQVSRNLMSKSTSSLRAAKDLGFAVSSSNIAKQTPPKFTQDALLKPLSSLSSRKFKSMTNVSRSHETLVPLNTSGSRGASLEAVMDTPNDPYLAKLVPPPTMQVPTIIPLPKGYSEEVLTALLDADEALKWAINDFQQWNDVQLLKIEARLTEAGFKLKELSPTSQETTNAEPSNAVATDAAETATNPSNTSNTVSIPNAELSNAQTALVATPKSGSGKPRSGGARRESSAVSGSNKKSGSASNSQQPQPVPQLTQPTQPVPPPTTQPESENATNTKVTQSAEAKPANEPSVVDSVISRTRQSAADPAFSFTVESLSDYLSQRIVEDTNERQKFENWGQKESILCEFISDRGDKVRVIKEILSEKVTAEEEMDRVKQNRKDFPFGTYNQGLVFDDNASKTAAQNVEDMPSISYLEAAALAEKSSGVFKKVRNIRINRTNNGLKPTWLCERNPLHDISAPGILEIESEYLGEVIPPGSLEPSRELPPAPKNTMHPFTEAELKLLSHMRARISYLRNPRFPNIVMPPTVGPLLRGELFSKIPKLPPSVSIGSSLFISPAYMPNGQTKQSSKILKAIGGGIVANPPAIYFTDYIPHKTYTKILSIKNKSPHSGRFRLSIPPPYTYSKYFKVTMIATPKPSDGLVAPGMSCQYRIDFTPDSLANFSQTLIVSTEIGGVLASAADNAGDINAIPTYPPFSVPIIAKRDPPILTIPDVLHCGPCRSGFVATRKWTFNNIGGTGRFLLMTEDETLNPYDVFESIRLGEETNLVEMVLDGKITDDSHKVRFTASRMEKTVGKAELIREGPFEIFPSYFGLESGEIRQITIQFKAKPLPPPQVTSSEAERAKSADSKRISESMSEVILRIACDNCQVLELPIRAVIQRPSVRIVQCQTLNAETGEKTISPLQGHLFAFGDQNVKATTTFIVTIHNNTRLKLPFRWVGVDNPGKKLTSGTLEGSLDFSVNDSFIFNPSTGYLPPNADMSFEVSFNPQEVKKYSVIGRLLLLEEEDRVVEREDGTLEVVPRETSNLRNLECVMDIFCTGVGLPYDVSIKPEIILVPGSLLISQPRETSARIINNSIANVDCEWTVENVDPTIVDIVVSLQKETGRDSGSKVLVKKSEPPVVVNVTMNGKFPGTVDGSLVFKTANGVGPNIRVPLKAKVELAQGALEFDTLIVNFGLLALGNMKVLKVPLVNRSAMTLRWKAAAYSRQSCYDEATGQKLWHLRISPSEGVLEPGSRQMVELTYIPTWYQSFRGVLACDIVATTPDGNTISSFVSCVEMRAEVQTPRACLLNYMNSLTCYVEIPFQWRVVAKNLTMLRSKFEWVSPESRDYSVKFEPKSAYLAPSEELEIMVEVTFKKVARFEGLIFKCKLDGMVENDGYMTATLDADVYGMNVNFKILDPIEVARGKQTQGFRTKLENRMTNTIKGKMMATASGPAPPLINSSLWKDGGPYMFDFGHDCPILENRTRTLIIRNKSAIPSPFRVWVETFTAMGIEDQGQNTDDDGFEESLHKHSEGHAAETANSTEKGRKSTNSKSGSKRRASQKEMPSASSSKSQLLLKPTKKEKIGFSSTTGKAWIESIKAARKMMQRMHFLLREGRGAAFHASPSHGVIEPFSEVRINLTSYNNLVGLYEDRFVCEIGKWVRETIPISLGVDGVPVKFTGAQLVATVKKSHGPERLNFGTRIIYTGSDDLIDVKLKDMDDVEEGAEAREAAGFTTKVVQVENQSPRTICLAWRTYVQRSPVSINSTSKEDGGPDTQTIEVIQTPTSTPGDVDINEICTEKYLLQPSEPSPVTVLPSPVYVPAFSSTPLEISFRAAEAGLYNAVLAAEVGYVQQDGSISPFPTQGNDLFQPKSAGGECSLKNVIIRNEIS